MTLMKAILFGGPGILSTLGRRFMGRSEAAIIRRKEITSKLVGRSWGTVTSMPLSNAGRIRAPARGIIEKLRTTENFYGLQYGGAV